MAGKFQTETLLDGMSRLGFSAANVTGRDLAMGVTAFLKLSRRAQFPLISANLVYQDTGKGLFPPYTIKTLGAGSWRGSSPLRIGVVGLAREDPAFLMRDDDARKVVIAPFVRAAELVVPSLTQEADIVILLTNLRHHEVARVIARVPGIDLVLGGHGDRVSGDHANPPRTSVVYAGDQGKWLGEIRLFLGRRGLVNLSIDHIFLDRRYPFHAETKEFEDQANIRINEYYRELAEETPAGPLEDVPLSARFVTGDRCGACHEEAARVWEAGGHAHAIETLVDVQQEYNPLCVPCHVTGYQEASGFQNVKATPAFANVQCEACHGPAGAHLEDFSTPYGKTDSTACLSCHTPANSPEFDFSSYWDRIKH